MRTKELKINDKTYTAILMAGGQGHKIYGVSGDKIVIEIKKKLVVLPENSPEEKIALKYANIKYYGPNEHDKIKDDFKSLLESLSTKNNPVRKQYGVKGGERLNLSQALYIRDNGYVSKTELDYDPQSVDERIFELQKNKDLKNVKNFEKQMSFNVDDRIRINLSWRVEGTYAVLSLPDLPFYSVTIRNSGTVFVAEVFDGTNVIKKKNFKKLEDAFIFCEKEFQTLSKDDADYNVKIV